MGVDNGLFAVILICFVVPCVCIEKLEEGEEKPFICALVGENGEKKRRRRRRRWSTEKKCLKQLKMLSNILNNNNNNEQKALV